MISGVPLLFGGGAVASSGHRYWRINVTKVQSDLYAAIAEIEMRATAGGVDQCNGGAATASSIAGWGNHGASLVFDNSSSTAWIGSYGLPQWLQYQFTDPVVVSELACMTANGLDIDHVGDFRDFTLSWSDDGVVFTTALTVVGEAGTWSDRPAFKTYAVP